MSPRKTPYTVAGIRRLKCYRCGQPAVHQWQICADGNVWRPLCLACDIALNRMVLVWMGFPDALVKVQRYEQAQRKAEAKP
jgi:hypothetical protein